MNKISEEQCRQVADRTVYVVNLRFSFFSSSLFVVSFSCIKFFVLYLTTFIPVYIVFSHPIFVVTFSTKSKSYFF